MTSIAMLIGKHSTKMSRRPPLVTAANCAIFSGLWNPTAASAMLLIAVFARGERTYKGFWGFGCNAPVQGVAEEVRFSRRLGTNWGLMFVEAGV